MTQTTRQTGTTRRMRFAKDLLDQRPDLAATAVLAPRGRCDVCESDYVRSVDLLLLDKKTPSQVATATGLTRTSIQSHWRVCRLESTEVVAIALGEARVVVPPPGQVSSPSATDFAAAVRDEAMKRLKEGTIAPNVAHGLQAQALLDRREERKQDRDLALNIARLLSGAAYAPPADLIEGDYVDVTAPAALGPGQPDT